MTVEISIEVAECLEESRRKEENLHHEQRRHWDDREMDEYIIVTEGRLPYCATPEELLCQQETLDESHAATIRRWITDDRRKGKGGLVDYSCKEGDSL